MTFKSLIGKCNAVRNSMRSISGATMTFSATLSITYTPGGLPISNTTISGSDTKAWTRVVLPSGIAHLTDIPGDGYFFAASTGCCCPCRDIYAFDSVPLELADRVGISAGLVGMPVSLTQSTDGDVNTLDRGVSIQLWAAGDPPCRNPDGPSSSPRARLQLPSDFFGPLTDPDPLVSDPVIPTITVSGTAAPVDMGISDSGLEYRIDFTAPDPCSNDQTYTAHVSVEWEGSQVSGSANVNFTFVLGA